MAITTYAELQAAIGNRLARTDLTDIIPEAIAMCESRLNYGSDGAFPSPALRVRQMETRATAVADGEYIALPDGFLVMRNLKVNVSPEKSLRFVTPQQFAESSAAFTSGTPVVYTIIGDEIRLGPVPDGSPELEMVYIKQIPALSDSNTTNWLLSAAPNVYLYGSLVDMAPYIADDERIPQWFSLFSSAVSGLRRQDRDARVGGAPLIMRPIGGTP